MRTLGTGWPCRKPLQSVLRTEEALLPGTARMSPTTPTYADKLANGTLGATLVDTYRSLVVKGRHVLSQGHKHRASGMGTDTEKQHALVVRARHSYVSGNK